MPILSTHTWSIRVVSSAYPYTSLQEACVMCQCSASPYSRWAVARLAPLHVRMLLANNEGWDVFVRWAAEHALQKTAQAVARR